MPSVRQAQYVFLAFAAALLGPSLAGGQEPVPSHGPPLPPPGQAIVVAGQEVKIGAPVVTWRDADGFDGYRESCFWLKGELPRRPAAGCRTRRRYAARNGLPADVAALTSNGTTHWTPGLAARVIDQVVVHYDVAWTSRTCFLVLHDYRGLSCHFLLDVDGTLYQTLDVVERARHAGQANDRSIGIEIAHPGPLGYTRGLAARYAHDAAGPVFDLGRSKVGHVRTPDFEVRPARPTPISGKIHGRTVAQYDFTRAQYETLARLLGGLNRALGLRLEAPQDGEGRLLTRALSARERAEFQGVMGLFHVTRNKVDPGPAFNWEDVFSAARGYARRRD